MRGIEITLALGLVALAGALGTPALLKAKDVTAREGCANNLKVLYQAFAAYTADYQGVLPPYSDNGTNYGFQLVTPYVPGAPKIARAAFGMDYMVCPEKKGCYGMNYPFVFGYTAQQFGQAGSAVLKKVHASVYLVADAREWGLYHAGEGTWAYATDSDGDGVKDTGPGGKYNNFLPVHEGGGNLLFADGNVKWVSLKDFLTNKDGIWGAVSFTAYH